MSAIEGLRLIYPGGCVRLGFIVNLCAVLRIWFGLDGSEWGSMCEWPDDERIPVVPTWSTSRFIYFDGTHVI